MQTTYVYDAFGNLAAEYGPSEASPCGTANPTPCYVSVDHLGSTRMLMDSTGTVQRRYDYLPFGTELLSGTDGRGTGYSSSPDDVGPKFTSQSRDQESTLDWFNVRDYSGAQGRFQSVDPGNAGADPSNPETWNMYAYVGNNPLSNTDSTGMFLDATAVGASVGGPWGAVVGAAIDLGALFYGLFGGGGHTPALANVSFPNEFPSAGPSGGPLGPGGSGDPWNEQAPFDGSGGGFNTGDLFGSGNTNPFVFSFEDGSQSWLQQNFGWLWAPPILPPYVKNDVPIYGLHGKGAQVLSAAGQRATHDLGCVGLGGAVTGTSMAASAEVIPKPFAAGGRAGTSIASKVFTGGLIGKQILTPVGTPGVNLEWKYTGNLGRVAARWLPWVWTAIGAAATYACLGTNP